MGEVIKTGRMAKKGDSLGRWTNSDFTLEHDSNGKGALLLYKSGFLGLESRVVRLRNNVVFQELPENGECDFSMTVKNWASRAHRPCMQMEPPKKTRTFHFRAPSTAEKESWVQAISLAAIRQTKKKDPAPEKEPPKPEEMIDLEEDTDDADTDTTSSNGDAVSPTSLAFSRETSASTKVKQGRFQRRSISLRMDDLTTVKEALTENQELLKASIEGDLEACKEMAISHPKQFCDEINCPDAKGFTPLHMACIGGHAKLAAFLVGAGAKVNARNQYSSTPAILASADGHVNVLEVLAQNKKVNFGLRLESGASALHVACQQGRVGAVRFLVKKKGIKIDEVTAKGATALMLASKRGHLEIVEILLENDANVNISMSPGSRGIGDMFSGLCTGTALDFARVNDHHDVSQLIVDYMNWQEEQARDRLLQQ